MKALQFRLFLLVFLVAAICSATTGISAQPDQPQSQEVSEIDGVPVLLKHLPHYENVRSQAVLATNKAGLIAAAGDQRVFDVIEFPAGTEAAIAPYPEGQVAIIEYTNPQLSSEVDNSIQQFLVSNPESVFVYRRIGNYSAFVFSPTDPAAANTLLDEIKYQKTVQWLGENPYLMQQLERYLVTTSRDIMISTVLVIVFGLGTALLTGIAVGLVFFRMRDQRRASSAAFSDAGGLTRLNLDGLSEEL